MYIYIYEKSRVRASPVIVFIELLLTMINLVDGRERVNSKDNFGGNPSVKAAEFSEVYIDLIKLDNKHQSKHYNITIHILFPDRD